MGKLHRKILAFSVALCLGFILLVWLSGPRYPTLTTTFLTTTNISGRWIARFAITNVGKATAVSSAHGKIEMSGHSQPLAVTCRAAVHRLSPGEGDVVEVFLQQRIDGPWRFTCLYARDGLRSRIYDWQWRANGPGPRANKLIPNFLKGVPLSVKGTSDWIDE